MIIENKKIRRRIQNKHDTAANWAAVESVFIPLKGEIIIYDPDENHTESRFKIGDGVRYLGELNFYGSSSYHITAPLLNCTAEGAGPVDWYLLLPSRKECLSIVLESVIYIYQPKNNQPSLRLLEINKEIWNSITETTNPITIPFTQGDGNDNEINCEISFSLDKYNDVFSCYNSYQTEGDTFNSLKTSYFKFKIIK